VEIQPGGREAKVRGIEVFGQAARVALAGRRTALNLAGVDRSELVRGMVVVEPGAAHPTRTLDVRLHYLASAPGPLRHRSPVRFHHGTSELVGRVYLLSGDQLSPGTSALCRLRLQDPTVAFPGDRFILRRYSPPTTIGGGIILDHQPGRVRRRDLPKLLAALDELASALEKGVDAERVLVRYLVRREGIRGLDLGALVVRTGLTGKAVEALCAETDGVVWIPQQSRAVWAADLAEREQAAVTLLQEFHASRPLASGMSREELKRKLLPDSADALFPFLLDRLQQANRVEVRGSTVSLAGRQPDLSPEQQQMRQAMLQWFDTHAFEEASPERLAGILGLAPSAAREVFFFLLQNGDLVRINEDLVLTRCRLEEIRRELRTRFAGRPFSVPDFKDFLGISRKFAIPLLEYLDRDRFTRRTGDTRVLL
jgi:selenocysteine-specific elongation factor